MVIETLTNKWVIMIVLTAVGSIAYFVLNKKDKTLETLEKEYTELLTSEQYKVKGQF